MDNDIVKYLRLSQTRFNRHAEVAEEIERLRAERDHWRSIAEQAVDNADQAVKLLEKLTGMSHD